MEQHSLHHTITSNILVTVGRLACHQNRGQGGRFEPTLNRITAASAQCGQPESPSNYAQQWHAKGVPDYPAPLVIVSISAARCLRIQLNQLPEGATGGRQGREGYECLLVVAHQDGRRRPGHHRIRQRSRRGQIGSLLQAEAGSGTLKRAPLATAMDRAACFHPIERSEMVQIRLLALARALPCDRV